MESMNTNTNNMEFQEIFNDHLEIIVQDFNEFRERMAQSSSSDAIKLEDLIDLFINNGRENSCSTEHNTVPPHQLQSENIDGFNMNTQIPEGEMMAQNMTENTSQNDVGVSNRVIHIRYGDLNFHEAAYGIIGSVFGGNAATGLDSVMRRLRTELGVKGNGDWTNSRTRVKRKYRGDTETEDEIAQGLGMEIIKTKKRDTTTTAQANREAHEACIHSQLWKLRQKIEHLRILATFLEDNKEDHSM